MATHYWMEIQSGWIRDKGNPREPMRGRHVASERTSHLTHLGPTGWMGREGKERKEGESFREISSTFSLDFQEIGPAVSGGARGKVHPRCKSFTSRLKLGSFDKLQEVGVFSYLV